MNRHLKIHIVLVITFLLLDRLEFDYKPQEIAVVHTRQNYFRAYYAWPDEWLSGGVTIIIGNCYWDFPKRQPKEPQ